MFRGADLRYDLELDLEQAVFGHASDIEFTTLTECEPCTGTRRGAGLQARHLRNLQRRRPGPHAAGLLRGSANLPALQRPRPDRQSAVRFLPRAGPAAQEEELHVKVPQGVDNGDRIRLTGEGEAGRNGGPPGDLYVEIRVREHAIFERDGSHLSCEVPVSFATAALGGSGRSADARTATSN